MINSVFHPAHQPAQGRERHRLRTCSRLRLAGTGCMPRRDWNCQQHFVLDQRSHRHFPPGNNAFGPLRIERRGIHLGLRRCQQQHGLDMQRMLEGPKTTLADQRQHSVHFQPQRRSPVFFRDAPQFVTESSFFSAQCIQQACKFRYRPCALQLRRSLRKFKAVDDGLVRHTGSNVIILKILCQNKAMPSPRQVVLASTSRYRRDLLERLGMPFECADPLADEAPLPGEAFADTARRLAEAKARAVADRFPDALVIGSDQVASCEGARLDKPGSHENAARQLRLVSGKTAVFDTAVAVLDTKSGALATKLVPCKVTFRPLLPAEIERYLRLEQPYDCAGSAKVEGLGITLIERIDTDDPTSLIGLPLIALGELLRNAGLDVLG